MASSKASAAGNASARPLRALASSAAERSSVHGSMRLLQGAPSAPSATIKPAARMARTFAIPLASFRFALGQWVMRVPALAITDISR